MSGITAMLGGFENHITLSPPVLEGEVIQIRGTLIEASMVGVAVGDIVEIKTPKKVLKAQVVALKKSTAMILPFGNISGLTIGAIVRPLESAALQGVGEALLGRVIDPLGEPLDGLPAPVLSHQLPIDSPAPLPLMRADITEQLSLGVRAIDAFIPCGKGQRLGIFAGPGVGKSVLLGMIAAATDADIVVLGLVGERGREVGHFVKDVLGEAMARSVVVVATSDQPAPLRVRAALTATTVAEYFRDQGKNVLLFIDSLTRFCMAQREIGLAVGEPPATKGYPPSAFSALAPLVERAAAVKGAGTITGLYTVLVEGDDMTDPVADTVQGLLDGHIILSRELANRGHYPAINVLSSVSRLAGELYEPQVRNAAMNVRNWLGKVEDARDLISVGAYRPGADAALDKALSKEHQMASFLRQGLQEQITLEQTTGHLLTLGAA